MTTIIAPTLGPMDCDVIFPHDDKGTGYGVDKYLAPQLVHGAIAQQLKKIVEGVITWQIEPLEPLGPIATDDEGLDVVVVATATIAGINVIFRVWV